MTAIDLSAVDTVITSRKSVRAYKKDAVSPELLRHLLEMAMHAPSTTNTQPWKVYVLTGAALKRLTDAVCAAFDTEAEKHRSEYAYYTFPVRMCNRGKGSGKTPFGIRLLSRQAA